MERELILGVFVDTFDDIDFTLVGPVGADSPVSRPDGATMRHRIEIEDEETVVVRALGRNAYTIFRTRE